ncbi:methyltransferase domain-containing protein [candidate division WOR-3 bacterium]|nr:methyltransferase domain-containing protein [candidate division WOR-3 bacterium]
MHRVVEQTQVMHAVEALYRAFPMARRLAYRAWYYQLARYDRHGEVAFTNYGYDWPEGEPAPELLPDDEAHRLGVQLYHHVATGAELAGRDVLEVGCGRGGGTSYIARYLKPRTTWGLDLDAGAIRFCRHAHRAPGLRFRRGSSERLPFAAGSFDAVVNVESSHCYGSMHSFLREVHRVLRPGGRFLIADFRNRERVGVLRGQFARAGFLVERELAITDRVFGALARDNERKLELIRRRVPAPFRAVFNQFAATEGTPTWEAFRTGSWQYLSFALRRNGPLPEAS